MENKKEYGLIVFPELDAKRKYFWLNLLLFTLASLMRRLIPAIIYQKIEPKIDENNVNNPNNELAENNYNKNHSFFDLFSNFLADILAGFIILINKCIEKIKSNKVTTANGEKDVEKMKKKSLLYLSFIAFIDILAQLCLLIFTFIIKDHELVGKQSIEQEDLYFTVLIDIISRYIFSRIFLKSYFYKHHIFAMILICIGFIPLIIKNIIDLSDKEINQYIYLILYIFMVIIYSLEDVFNKICLKQSLLRPYELMFYKAVIQIIVVLILLIYFLANEGLFNYIKQYLSGLSLLYRITFIGFNILRTWSLITVIEIIDANCLSILKSFEFIFLFVSFSIVFGYEDTGILITGSFCAIISLIGTAIHNEVFIINKCGLLEESVYYKEIKHDDPSLEDLEKEAHNKSNNKTVDSLLGSSLEE
jgi:hypothetical protein